MQILLLRQNRRNPIQTKSNGQPTRLVQLNPHRKHRFRYWVPPLNLFRGVSSYNIETMKPNQTHRKLCRRYNLPGHAHELTFSCFRQQKFLIWERTCLYLVEALQKAREKHDFSLWAYVFMPEHVHLLLCPRYQDYSIAKILQSIKQPVGRRCIMYLKHHNPAGLQWMKTGQTDPPYRFWQDGGGYDRNITQENTLIEVVKYIHQNPIRRGLVDNAEKWKYSSAQFWQSGKGPLSINTDTWPIS